MGTTKEEGSKHTPGPWDVTPRGNVASQSEVIARLPARPRRDADAALIAAAPDLLEALEALVQAQPSYPSGGYLERYVARARASIAKARGGK